MTPCVQSGKRGKTHQYCLRGRMAEWKRPLGLWTVSWTAAIPGGGSWDNASGCALARVRVETLLYVMKRSWFWRCPHTPRGPCGLRQCLRCPRSTGKRSKYAKEPRARSWRCQESLAVGRTLLSSCSGLRLHPLLPLAVFLWKFHVASWYSHACLELSA